jgi:hypothetical protein
VQPVLAASRRRLALRGLGDGQVAPLGLRGGGGNRGKVVLAVQKFLWQGTCYQQLQVKNYGLELVETSLS